MKTITEQIKELSELKNSGNITEEEYEKLKKDLIASSGREISKNESQNPQFSAEVENRIVQGLAKIDKSIKEEATYRPSLWKSFKYEVKAFLFVFIPVAIIVGAFHLFVISRYS